MVSYEYVPQVLEFFLLHDPSLLLDLKRWFVVMADIELMLDA